MMNMFRKKVPELMYEETRETLWDDVNESRCPVCREEEALRKGPEGGAGFNVACVACGSRFNFTWAARGMLEWTHGPSDPTPMGTEAYRSPDPERVELVRQLTEA